MPETTTPHAHIVFDHTFIAEAQRVLEEKLLGALHATPLNIEFTPDEERSYLNNAVDSLALLWQPGRAINDVTKLADPMLTGFANYSEWLTLNKCLIANYNPAEHGKSYKEYSKFVQQHWLPALVTLRELPVQVLFVHYLLHYDIDIFNCEETIA